MSVALEKVQVAALAERLDDLLDELEQRGVEGAAEDELPAVDGAGEPLDEPINEAFRAATLSLGWDGSNGKVLVEARAPTDDEDDEPLDEDDTSPDGPDVLRVRLLPVEARTFVEHAVRVLGSGRPPCPLCGQPLDPLGHLCPRRNGHLLN